MVEARLNPLRYQRLTGKLLVGSLLILAGISLGAGVTDWVDSPRAAHAFLDDGWVRSLVDGWGWIFMLAALLAYSVRMRLASRNTQIPRVFVGKIPIFVGRIPIEVVAVSILAGVTALGLSWLSVQYIPCVLEARC